MAANLIEYSLAIHRDKNDIEDILISCVVKYVFSYVMTKKNNLS